MTTSSKDKAIILFRNIWQQSPLIIFIIGWIPYAYGYKAMPTLFSLPIFFQIIFKLLGVECNLKEELIAYANTGFSGINSKPNYYFEDLDDYRVNPATGLRIREVFDSGGNLNGESETNIHIEHEIFFEYRD